MSVIQKLIIRPETVENIYDFYQNRTLLVNRRYQRKLVWTVEEKEGFIDSLSNGFPVPLILVTEVKYKGQIGFEIIDGMQRLDAITSFIEGNISLNGKYFDLDTIANTKYLMDTGQLTQKVPKLDREICKGIASYPLPLSVSQISSESRIDEIFRRINSNGRHLSKQELRQVGSKSDFAELVKQISETIRGDVSHSSRLLLNEMKKVSINNYDLDYGINMGGIFWRKHNIVTSKNIRESRDEELVASLLSSILISPRPSSTAANLDKFYGFNPEKGNPIIENKIRQLGFDFIKEQFETIFGELRQCLESTRSSFFKLLFRQDTKYTARSFQVLFLAFYDLIVRENMKISSYTKLAFALKGIGDSYLTPNAEKLHQSKKREIAVDAIKGVIRKHFVKRDSNDPILSNGVVKLESLLSRSRTENSSYDFKLGFHRLDNNGEFDEKAFEKVLKSLTAIVNSGKGTTGYIVVGVADTERDAARFKQYYNSTSILFKTFHVTGVDKEAQKYSSFEEYRSKIEARIKNSKITPQCYRNYLLRNIDFFNYYDKSILILEIKADEEPAEYDGQLYQRQGTSTELVPVDQKKQIWKNFL